jgi:hypothetical protein
MVYLSIVFIPFIILFNAYFLGKYIQKSNLSINGYLATALGFCMTLTIFFLLSIILYLSQVSIEIYLILFLIAQAILFILYCLNYRMAFTTFSVHKKPLICFCTIAIITAGLMILTILVGYHKNGVYYVNTKQYHDIFNYMNRLPALTFTNVINFHGTGDFNFNSFSVLSIMAVCYKVLFNVSNVDINTYLF